MQQHAGAEPETARGHLAPKLPRCGGSLLVLRVWGIEWRSSDNEAHEEAAATTGTGRRLRQRGGSNNDDGDGDDGLLLFSCVPNPRRIWPASDARPARSWRHAWVKKKTALAPLVFWGFYKGFRACVREHLLSFHQGICFRSWHRLLKIRGSLQLKCGGLSTALRSMEALVETLTGTS